ncbi:phospholipid:diacylglycerol acyltransferase, partial [Coemansia aciculifera]
MSKGGDNTPGQNSDSVRRRRKSRKDNRIEHNSDSEPSTPTVTGTPHSSSQVEVARQELESAILKTKGIDALPLDPVAVSTGRVKRRRWFIAGLVFGGLAALTSILYVNPTKSVHIDRIHGMLGDFDISALLPDSLLPDDFVQDITRLLSLDSVGVDSNSSSSVNYSKGDFQPALTLVAEEKLEKVHNVILIPGIISSGLESWSTANCSRP